MSTACSSPIPLEDLIAYERAELAEPEEDRVEQHLFACARCSVRLAFLSAIADGVTDLARSGGITATATLKLVRDAEASGLTLRTYRLQEKDSVNCTAGPDDDFVVMRFAVDVERGESVDLSAEMLELETGRQRAQVARDVAVDHEQREIVFVYSADLIRSIPRSRWTLRASVHGARGGRELGPYVLNHTPWEEMEGGA